MSWIHFLKVWKNYGLKSIKMLLRESKDLNQWRDIQYSWLEDTIPLRGQIFPVKVFNAIYIKISVEISLCLGDKTAFEYNILSFLCITVLNLLILWWGLLHPHSKQIMVSNFPLWSLPTFAVRLMLLFGNAFKNSFSPPLLFDRALICIISLNVARAPSVRPSWD